MTETKTVKKEKPHFSVIITVILAALIVVGVFGYKIWKNSSVASDSAVAMKVGDKEISQTEFSYYYYSSINNMISTYQQYGLLDMLGIDTSTTDFLKENCNFAEGKTWGEYFADTAADTITETYVLLSESEKAGFTPDQTKIDETLNQWKTVMQGNATSNNTNLDTYVAAAYGKNVTWDKFAKYLTNVMISEQYEESLQKAVEVSDDEINSKFEEDKADFYSVNYRSLSFEYEEPEEDEKEPVENAEVEAEEPEVVKDTKDQAKAKADDFLAKAVDENTFKTLATATLDDETKKKYEDEGTDFTLSTGAASSLSGDASTWAIDASRKAGDKTVVDNGSGYTVYYFISAELKDYNLVNARMISFDASEENAEAKANEVVKKFSEGDKSEDSFISLVKEYNEGATNDGLYEGLTKDYVPTALTDWVFSSDRKAGDVEKFYENSTEGSEAYYVVYFKEFGGKYWYESLKSTLKDSKYTEQFNALKETYKVEKTDSVIAEVIG